MSKNGNFIEAANGQELSAADIERSGCSIIVVVPPAEGPAVEHSIICLPRAAAAAKGEITIVFRCDAFAYTVVPQAPETIDGQQLFVKTGGGVRLVPLISEDGTADGWGTV